MLRYLGVFRQMPFILIAIITVLICFDAWIPFLLQQILYTLALTIKAGIIFLLPFIIFSLLFKAAIVLSKKATWIIGLILLLVCCSNFISTFLAHFVGEWIYHFKLTLLPPKAASGLTPLWTVVLPQLIANDKAMFGGIILGLLVGRFYPQHKALMLATKIERWVDIFLQGFVYVIPFFVAGFVVKLQYDHVMTLILKDYLQVFLFVGVAQFAYILLVYLVLSRFNLKEWSRLLKNMLPPFIGGFSTMSSAATMPLTIIAVKNNTRNHEVAKSVVPATVNIHLTGDCFAIPIFAYAVLKSFGIDEPSLATYLVFAGYFVLAKFSVAGIPGGGVLVMLPVLQAHFGFEGDMLSMITALYILFDPIITSANVLGNGAFAKVIDNCVLWFSSLKKH